MTLDAYVDATPWRSDAFAVVDDFGAELAPHAGLPPLGGGLRLGLLSSEVATYGVVIDAGQTTSAYDTDLAWSATRWSLDLDAGMSVPMVPRGEGLFALDWEIGTGLRGALLAQPWWDDFLFWGVGAHFGLTSTWGRGSVLGLFGAKVSAGIVPGAITGTLDSAADDLTWTWGASGARVAIHAGVAIR